MVAKRLQEDDGWGRAEVLGLVQFVLETNISNKYVSALSVHRLCSNLDKLYITDVFSVSNACRKLISHLEALSTATFRDKEWVAIVQSLALGNPILSGTLSDCISSSDANVTFDFSADDGKKDGKNITRDVCRLNAAYLSGSDLLLRTILKLFSKQQLSHVDKTVSSDSWEWNTGGASLADNSERITLISQLLMCPWSGFSEKLQKIIRSIGTCVLYLVGSLPLSDSPPPLESEFVNDALSLHLNTMQLTAFSLEDSSVYSKMVVDLYLKVMDKMRNSAHLVIIAQGLLSFLPLLGYSSTTTPSLSGVLWRTAAAACKKTTIQPVTHNADISKVPIASPEDDSEPTFAQWFDNFIDVPAIVVAMTQGTGNNSELISITVRCLRCLSQLSCGLDNCSDELISVAIQSGRLGDEQLISQFGVVYGHLLNTSGISDNTQKDVIDQLLSDLESKRSMSTCDILGVIVSAQASVKESSAALCIISRAVDMASNGTIDKFQLELIREMCPLLTSTDSASLLKKLIPITQQLLKRLQTEETSDEKEKEKEMDRVFGLLHFVHVLLRGGRDLVKIDLFYAVEKEYFKKETTRKSGPKATEATNTKWQMERELIGISGEEWSQFLCDVAIITHRCADPKRIFPSAALPPLNTEFLRLVSSEQSTLPVLTMLFRQYSLLFDENSRAFLKTFNADDSSFESVLFKSIARDEICPLAIRFLRMLREEVDKESVPLSSLVPVMDAVFCLHSSSLTFTPELCDEIIDFIEFLERTALISVCRLFESVGGVDRIHTLLRVWRNPLLKEKLTEAEDLLSEAVIADISSYVDAFVGPLYSHNDIILTCPLPQYNWFPQISDSECGDVECVSLRLLHDQLTRDLLQKRVNVPESKSEKLTIWLYKSHALQTVVASALANQAIKKSGDESPVWSCRLISVVVELLHGVSDGRPKYPIEVRYLPDVFSDILFKLVQIPSLPWSSLSPSVTADLIKLWDEKDSTYSLTIPFLNVVQNIVSSDVVIPTARDLLLIPLQHSISHFPQWLSTAISPLPAWNAAGPLFQYLETIPECRESVRKAVSECAGVVLRPNVLDELHAYYVIDIQTTDRFAQSLLKYRGSAEVADMSASMNESIDSIIGNIGKGSGIGECLEEGADPVRDALQLLCQFASPELHITIATRAVELIDKWMTLSTKEESVLKGESVLNGDNRLVWRVILLTNLLNYLNELMTNVNPEWEQSPYYSDDESLKDNILRKQTFAPMAALPAPPRKGGVMELCTFASTDKEFITQHWYNCHTCKMTDTVGVCSVCAINCHRDHDLSYSKKGSFFCDCGAKGCKSLSEVEHDVFATRPITRGAIGVHCQGETVVPSTHSSLSPLFDEVNFEGIDTKALKKVLEFLRESLDKKAELIHLFFKATRTASESRWLLNSRRGDVTTSFSSGNFEVKSVDLMTTTSISRIEGLERRPETTVVATAGERQQTRQLCGVINTSGGKTLLLLIAEGSNNVTIVHTTEDGQLNGKSELPDWRVDSENIGFSAKRITCRDDKCVIVSHNEFLLLRFGKDAEIVDRASCRLPESLSTNPIVKAEWGYGRPLLAIATMQFVRIFDICKNMDECVEELVLPLGNVVDVVVYSKAGGGAVRVLVLSSVGHLYIHQLNVNPEANPDNSSYFLTNTINLPQISNGVSMHFSPDCHVLFLSTQSGTFYAQIPNEDFSALNTEHFKKLELEDPVHIWNESNGLISCVSTQNAQKITFMYPTKKQLQIQTLSSVRPITCHILMVTPTADGHVSILLHNDPQRRCSVLNSNWSNEPDLWIRDLPRVVHTISDSQHNEEENLKEATQSDMVTMFEHTQLLKRIEFSSEKLLPYYDDEELTKRLNTVGQMPITSLQKDFDVTCRILEWNFVVRGIRIEVPMGTTRPPVSVTVLGKTYPLSSDSPRTFDIRLTRSQSLSIEKTVILDFHHSRSGWNSVVSVQIFGVSRREFGWPRPSKCLVSPLSLPQHMIAKLIETYRVMLKNGVKFKDHDILLSLSMSLSSPRSAHPALCMSASRLLRIAVPNSNDYYNYKDKTVINDLLRFHIGGPTIPSDIMADFIAHLKLMLCTRLVHFIKLVENAASFKNMVAFCAFLREQLDDTDGDPTDLLEFYCVLVQMLIAMKHSQSGTLIKQYCSLFRWPKTCRYAIRIRSIIQHLMKTYIEVAKSDRAVAKGLDPNRLLMVWGGANPFYRTSKLVSENAEAKEWEERMGKLITVKELLGMDMFKSGECEWIFQLLSGLFEQIRDDGSVGSVPEQSEGMGPVPLEALPATNMIHLALMMISSLRPHQQMPLVRDVISMIDFKSRNNTASSPDKYRQLLLIRFVFAFMTKWDETLEKKRVKDSKEQSPADGRESSIVDDNKEKVEVKGDDTRTQSISPSHTDPLNDNVPVQVAEELLSSGAMEFCLDVLENNVDYWRLFTEPAKVPRAWVKDPVQFVGDPYSLRSTTTIEHPDNHRMMMTEVALRIPLQMKKVMPDLQFDPRWQPVLCQLSSCQKVTQIRRASRKLLCALCDNDKGKYRVAKDKHLISGKIALLNAAFLSSQGGALSHPKLTEMVEIVHSIAQVAIERTAVWRVICMSQLNWLLSMACKVADAVSGSVVELLVTAIRHQPEGEEIDASGGGGGHGDLVECQLADLLIGNEENRALFKMLLVRYLIGRDENRRWTLHGMVRSTIQLASRQNQITLIRILWSDLWPLARGLGAHGAQLGDILATYAPRLLPSTDLLTLAEEEIAAIKDAAERMKECGHDASYRQMSGLGLGWKEAMLMDTSPCLVCTTRQDTPQAMKMSVIKQDSRYTTNAQMIKLTGHYEVSRVVIKLSDVKRTKTIRKVNLHYCQKVVESAVDLKNSPDLWQKAATAVVNATDTEITLSLAIPVVTSGLIVEFAELNESRMATELHCPRCSSLVQPNPGVCENCGENVFQCVKCRSINYDEKEPFLCNSCGFCKYARMDMIVHCRPLPSVCPITNDQEWMQSIESVGKLLCEMEQTRTSLVAARALGEALWLKARPLAPIGLHAESVEHAATLTQAIPQLNPNQSSVAALALCTAHCKAVHEELCTQTSQLIAFREELRSFERSSGGPLLHQALNLGFYSTSAHCFGCISSSIIHAISIISATCDDESVLEKVMDNSFVWDDLVRLGMHYDPLRDEMELLLCRLAFENEKGVKRLCSLAESQLISGTVIARSLTQFPDSYWQTKLKALVQVAITNPSDENTSLSLLSVLDRYLNEGYALKKRAQRKREEDKRGEEMTEEEMDTDTEEKEVPKLARRIHIENAHLSTLPSVGEWLDGERGWKEMREQRNKEEKKETKEKGQTAQLLLTEKYSWWLWECVFSSWISVRSSASRLLHTLSKYPGHAGTAVALVITGISRGALARPGRTDQFFRVSQLILHKPQVKIRLYAANFHVHLLNLIYQECCVMHEEELRETTMDHWFGYRLRSYVEMLCTLFSGSMVESLLLRAVRSSILIPVFQSTVFLKRVLLKRTRAVDAARNALEKLLKRISAKDPEELMRAAVQSLDVVDDFNTQAQIVSVIVDVIHPVQKDDDDFLLQIEKDPAQEDFLQGRMTGNPYKSTDAGFGPLMRDIKNKICRDCELVALLEDDNGMELLVNNNIIALNLPVKAVYEKIWKKEHPGQPMIIIYRMRGLLGDAVEQFISNLNEAGTGENEIDAVSASLTRSLAQCGGIRKSLDLLDKASLSAAGRFLFSQLKKLLERCLLTEDGRRSMVEAGAISRFLHVFRKCIEEKKDEAVQNIGVDYLKMLESLVCDVKMHEILEGVSTTDMEWLIWLAMMQNEVVLPGGRVMRRSAALQVTVTASVRDTLCRVTPNLCVGSDVTMKALITHYYTSFNFEQIDALRSQSAQERALYSIGVDCAMIQQILPSSRGNALKRGIIDGGVLKWCADYLLKDHPPLYNAVESPEWKAYLGRPCLKMVLTLMGGMAKGHVGSQEAIAEKSLHILHRLEQVASADCVGTLAENVMDALKENSEVAAQIEAVRLETKQKKRQMAMTMRQKQLTRMGMQLGKGGEVKVSSRKIANEPLLDDVALDPLQSCCICRESISTGPRVPCAYAFAIPLDPRNAGDGAPAAFSTVSQMVMVHMDCHQNAIRRTTGRGSSDEWTKAALHNAGANCNVLMPIAIASPSSADWNASIHRAEADISVVSVTCAITRPNIFADMCNLIDRFVNFKSFSDQSKGGGRESNAQYLSVLHLLALSLNEGQGDLPTSDPCQRLVSFLLTEHTVDGWYEERSDVLRAGLEDGVRVGMNGWDGLKPILLTWAFVDTYFNSVIKIVGDDRLEWLKENFVETLKKTTKFVKNFDEDIAPCEGMEEFADVMTLNVDDFLHFFV